MFEVSSNVPYLFCADDGVGARHAPSLANCAAPFSLFGILSIADLTTRIDPLLRSNRLGSPILINSGSSA
jgi:hypothetical protein